MKRPVDKTFEKNESQRLIEQIYLKNERIEELHAEINSFKSVLLKIADLTNVSCSIKPETTPDKIATWIEQSITSDANKRETAEAERDELKRIAVISRGK